MTKSLSEIVRESIRQRMYPWRLLSRRGIPCNPLSWRTYSGIELLALASVAEQRHYRSRFWATLREWNALGFRIRERPAEVPADMTPVTALDGRRLFNAEQIDRAEQHLAQPKEWIGDVDYREAERVIKATGAKIKRNRRCSYPRYLRFKDCIVLPMNWISESQRISTIFHELAHFAESRLGWLGSECQGELIAEAASGIMEAELGLPHDWDYANHEKWRESWIVQSYFDPNYMIEAAAQASLAADFLLSFTTRQSHPARTSSVKSFAVTA